MVDPHGDIAAKPVVERDHSGHVCLAVVVKGFVEIGFGAADIAEMDEKDLLGQFCRCLDDVFAHRAVGRLAKGDAETVAGIQG